MPLQSIKRRIKSVSSTKQMTKAMQLVASSKLRRAEAALAVPTAYTQTARELVDRLAASPLAQNHPLLKPSPTRTSLTILVAGDRGLAGAYNANLYRELSSRLHEIDGARQVITIGRRAGSHLARFVNLKLIAAYDIDTTAEVATLAAPILKQALNLYEAGEIDSVRLIATKFESTVKQAVITTQLLPHPLPTLNPIAPQPSLESGLEATLTEAITRLIEGELVQAITQARASEQAARMLAMMNATDNASDLIDDLTLELNTVRQARITQELAEISTGVAAVGI